MKKIFKIAAFMSIALIACWLSAQTATVTCNSSTGTFAAGTSTLTIPCTVIVTPVPSPFPVTPPAGATTFPNLEQQGGWTSAADSSISPNPPSIYTIQQAGNIMTLITKGQPGKYTGWMARKTLPIPAGQLHMLLDSPINLSSVVGVQAFEVGRRMTNAAGITDNGQTQFVPLGNGTMEYDIVPGASGGWKDTGCRFPMPVPGVANHAQIEYVDDADGALSIPYVMWNGKVCAIPANMQHIAGAKYGWSPNEAVVAFQPDANPKAVPYDATVGMSVTTW